MDTKVSNFAECTREYWVGWILARYQWERNIRFARLAELGLDAEKVYGMYVLHEADPWKFIDAADAIRIERENLEENRLRRIRAYANLTQKVLSEKSGVSLRMIQLYEQGQNDLSKAQGCRW